jgi:uncharacterized protein (DUF2147 family)
MKKASKTELLVNVVSWLSVSIRGTLFSSTMRKLLLGMFILILPISVKAQNRDAILGYWLTKDGNGKVGIYKKNHQYIGKITWLKSGADSKNTPVTDRRNLNPALRSRPILDLLILKNLTFNGKDYSGGAIYDPESGKTYTCEVQVTGNILKLTGFIGMFAVRTVTWTKTN